MIRKGVLLVAVLALLAVRPAPAAAQLGLSVGCSPGIPSCGSLRFFLSATGSEVALNDLFILITSPGWTFKPGGSPTVGSYDAQDSFGPYSGFTTIGAAGTSLAINFNDNGFPFDVFAGETGTLDVEDIGPGNANNLYFDYSGHTATGAVVAGSVTPEPVSMVLLGTGLAGLGGFARRRKRVPQEG